MIDIKDNNFKIYESKIIKTLSHFSFSFINQIILLKDGRLASSFFNRSIIIFNKENYTIELEIEYLDSHV